MKPFVVKKEKSGCKRALRLLATTCLFSFAVASFAAEQSSTRVEPAWERALGGDAACAPAAFRDRVFVLSVDRSITCLDDEGGFVWRKVLRNRPAPRLMVSKNGLVCVFGRNGEMSAFSANGILLWTYSGKTGSLPVLDPYEGRDGRLFILYEDEIICLAANGAQKWRSPINGRNAMLISEDGRGNALVISSSGDVLPVSPYGTVFPAVKTGLGIRSAVPLSGNACALFVPESSSSWKIAAADFNPTRKDESQAPDILWEMGGLSQIAAALYREGTLYCAGIDGRLYMLNATDGSLIFQSDFPAQGSSAGASMFHDNGGEGGRLILLAQEFCAAFSEEGELLWHVAFSRPLANPVFTENGFAVSAPQDSVLAAFRVEVLPKRKSRAFSEASSRVTYGIFAGKSRDYGHPEGLNFRYFEEVRKKIEGGNLGSDERNISRRLAEILNGDTGNPLSSVRYEAYQRSLAASLLGQMGSEEARGILLAAARRERDPTAIAGILRGLASLGPESGRQTLDTVLSILQRLKNAEGIALAACDTLYSLVQSSFGDVAEEAASIIFSCTGKQYSASVQKYASELLEKLLEIGL